MRCFRVGVLLEVIVRTGTNLMTFKDSSDSLDSHGLPSSLFSSLTVRQGYGKQPGFLHREGIISTDSLLRTVLVRAYILCFQED